MEEKRNEPPRHQDTKVGKERGCKDLDFPPNPSFSLFLSLVSWCLGGSFLFSSDLLD
jgi:hypothetical protein